MSTNKYIDKICCVIVVITVIVSAFAMGINALDIDKYAESGYELKLFDDSYVHTIDIIIDDWDGFIENCESEEYATCSVIIDNESYKNVAIRAKGNTSLSRVEEYGNDRYSFKIEFDHYEAKTYYGLDKLSLNNIIQDNTYMKDYLVYTLMKEHGVTAPLCSFVNIKVNGETWGLYLAVEGVEDSFLQRNYGSDYGELYKPDSMNMGGGRGNGKDFSEETFNAISGANESNASETSSDVTQSEASINAQQAEAETAITQDNAINGAFSQMPTGNMGELPENFQLPEDLEIPENGEMPQRQNDDNRGGFGGMSNGSSDVLLQYTDDSYNSYTNIFDNAKTDLTDADKDRLINSLKTLGEGNDIETCVDIEEVIRYFVVHNFVCNFDSYTGQMIHNYYLYEKDGILSMIPWDYNLAFGGFMSGADATSLVNFPIDSPVSGGDASDRPMIAWIFNNSEYTELYHQYMSEFITDVFDSGWFNEKFTEVSDMIAPYVENDPTSFCSYEEFTAGADVLKTFCELRAQSVKGQLDGTIPSTSDGQNKDNTSLVDAGDLNVNSMGSMGGSTQQGKRDFGQFDKNMNGESAENTVNAESTHNNVTDTSDSVQLVSGFETPTVTFLTVTEGTTEDNNVQQIPQMGEMPQGGQIPQNGEMPQGNMGNMTPPEKPDGDMGNMTPPQNPNGNTGVMPGGDFGSQISPTEENATGDNTQQETENVNESDVQNDTVLPEDENFDRGSMGQQNSGQFSGNGNQNNRQEYLMLGGCTLLLIGALIFAKCFKRYKYPK